MRAMHAMRATCLKFVGCAVGRVAGVAGERVTARKEEIWPVAGVVAFRLLFSVRTQRLSAAYGQFCAALQR